MRLIYSILTYDAMHVAWPTLHLLHLSMNDWLSPHQKWLRLLNRFIHGILEHHVKPTMEIIREKLERRERRVQTMSGSMYDYTIQVHDLENQNGVERQNFTSLLYTWSFMQAYTQWSYLYLILHQGRVATPNYTAHRQTNQVSLIRDPHWATCISHRLMKFLEQHVCMRFVIFCN